jgi:hypothetical protein
VVKCVSEGKAQEPRAKGKGSTLQDLTLLVAEWTNRNGLDTFEARNVSTDACKE